MVCPSDMSKYLRTFNGMARGGGSPPTFKGSERQERRRALVISFSWQYICFYFILRNLYAHPNSSGKDSSCRLCCTTSPHISIHASESCSSTNVLAGELHSVRRHFYSIQIYMTLYKETKFSSYQN